MNEKIKKGLILIKQHKIILAILLIGIGLFYWFQIQPSMIYSTCHKRAIESAMEKYKDTFSREIDIKYAEEKGIFRKDDYEFYYKRCLREKGINK